MYDGTHVWMLDVAVGTICILNILCPFMWAYQEIYLIKQNHIMLSILLCRRYEVSLARKPVKVQRNLLIWDMEVKIYVIIKRDECKINLTWFIRHIKCTHISFCQEICSCHVGRLQHFSFNLYTFQTNMNMLDHLTLMSKTPFHFTSKTRKYRKIRKIDYSYSLRRIHHITSFWKSNSSFIKIIEEHWCYL